MNIVKTVDKEGTRRCVSLISVDNYVDSVDRLGKLVHKILRLSVIMQ